MTEERSTLQEEFFDEAMGIHRFHTIDGETMMDKQIAPQEFAVAEILPYGMTVLSGPSKAGKSFLTLNLCLSVAKGEPFLGFPVRGTTISPLSRQAASKGATGVSATSTLPSRTVVVETITVSLAQNCGCGS